MMLNEFRSKSVQVLKELRALTAPNWTFSVSVLPLSKDRDIGYVVLAKNTVTQIIDGVEHTFVTNLVHTLEVLKFGKIYQIDIEVIHNDVPTNTVIVHRNDRGRLSGEPPLTMDNVIDLDSFKHYILESLPL